MYRLLYKVPSEQVDSAPWIEYPAVSNALFDSTEELINKMPIFMPESWRSYYWAIEQLPNGNITEIYSYKGK